MTVPPSEPRVRRLPTRRRRRAVLLVAVLVGGGLFLLPAFSRLLTDWWWFREIGYQVVFTRQILYQIALFLGAGVVGFLALYLNLRAAQRGLVPNPVLFTLGEGMPSFNLNAILRRLTFPVALGVGLITAFSGAGAWDVLLQAIYRTPFAFPDGLPKVHELYGGPPRG